jgi:hypothetical protein
MWYDEFWEHEGHEYGSLCGMGGRPLTSYIKDWRADYEQALSIYHEHRTLRNYRAYLRGFRAGFEEQWRKQVAQFSGGRQ